MLESLGREELHADEEEAWNILVNCDKEGRLGLSEWLVKCGNTSCRYVHWSLLTLHWSLLTYLFCEWLVKCGNTSCRYVLCTYVCTHVCSGFVFSFLGLCVLMYAND